MHNSKYQCHKLWQQTAHTTYHCSTRAIQTQNKKPPPGETYQFENVLRKGHENGQGRKRIRQKQQQQQPNGNKNNRIRQKQERKQEMGIK